MQNLREKLLGTSDFVVGVELVSIRGSMAETAAVRARHLAGQLEYSPLVDWVSVTDNAGGNPQLAPQALAKPVLYAGKEVVIHLTCKDLNRNGLESAAWQLDSEGFRNVLALTGDYPIGGNEGTAKPVFDLDSVGLIALLDKMNGGFDGRHRATEFCIGAVTSNHKLLEGEVIPQYLKLEKKVACGARFIVNQIGYDARKARELKRYMDLHGMASTPLIGNVYVLGPRAARLFHDGRIPGVVVTRELLAECEKQDRSPDAGAAFFHEFAARQVAVFRGLGYRGAYLGGIQDLSTVERILAIERAFSPDDWKGFAREISFSRPREFFLYAEDDAAGPTEHPVSAPARDGPEAGPEVAYLCPESQCAKNQRNGPCGGTREGRCEVDGYGDCVWLHAYERLRHGGAERTLLQHAPVVQDQGLRGTSSWANSWLGRDHAARAERSPHR